MYVEKAFAFASSQVLTGTNADQISAQVFDNLVAEKVFAGAPGLKIAVSLSAAGGTTPNFRARLVGADNAALTSNPVIIADTGTTPAIVAADLPIYREFTPSNQQTAKRYYGMQFTMAGHATDNTGTVSANMVLTGQSNLIK